MSYEGRNMNKEKSSLEPWYKVVTPRPEVRKGRSFNPDEFAIALEQVVAGTAPSDYLDPKQFFARTVFTRASGITSRPASRRTERTPGSLTAIFGDFTRW